MVRAGIKVLAAALIIDSLVAAWLFINNSQLLMWWLLANAAALPSAAVVMLARRRRPEVIQKHPTRTFSEHQKLHGSEHETLKGEVVKSGGERIIADYLYRNKIRYVYEKPVVGPTGRMISRPDFYLSDYDVYVEYWGMADTKDGKDRRQYTKGMEWKMARYRENGIRLVSIYPREIDRLDSIFQQKLKEVM